MELREYIEKTAITEKRLVTIRSLEKNLGMTLEAAKKELWEYFKDNNEEVEASFLVNYVEESKICCQFVNSQNIEEFINKKGKKFILDIVLYGVRSKDSLPIELNEIINTDSMEKLYY